MPESTHAFVNGGPVGTVLKPGSTSLRLTLREREVADLVGCGFSYKKIGRELGITSMGVGAHVSNIAGRIPGTGAARLKVAAWVWVYGDTA